MGINEFRHKGRKYGMKEGRERREVEGREEGRNKQRNKETKKERKKIKYYLDGICAFQKSAIGRILGRKKEWHIHSVLY